MCCLLKINQQKNVLHVIQELRKSWGIFNFRYLVRRVSWSCLQLVDWGYHTHGLQVLMTFFNHLWSYKYNNSPNEAHNLPSLWLIDVLLLLPNSTDLTMKIRLENFVIIIFYHNTRFYIVDLCIAAQFKKDKYGQTQYDLDSSFTARCLNCHKHSTTIPTLHRVLLK